DHYPMALVKGLNEPDARRRFLTNLEFAEVGRVFAKLGSSFATDFLTNEHRRMANRLVYFMGFRAQHGCHSAVRTGSRMAAGTSPVAGQVHRRNAYFLAARHAAGCDRPHSAEDFWAAR